MELTTLANFDLWTPETWAVELFSMSSRDLHLVDLLRNILVHILRNLNNWISQHYTEAVGHNSSFGDGNCILQTFATIWSFENVLNRTTINYHIFPSPPATNCPISANELLQMMQHSCYFVVQSLRLFHAVSSSIRKSCMWAAWNISHAQARDKHQKFTEYFELCLMICK